MVRKLGALLGCLSLALTTVVVSAPPAAAAAATVAVPGHNLPTVGLQEFRSSCTNIISSPPAASPLLRSGGTLGSHSIGWQSSPGFAAGALAPVPHPTSLSFVAADLYVPSGFSDRLMLTAFYQDNSRPGFYIGFQIFSWTFSGFGSTINFANSQLVWSYIDPNPANTVFNYVSATLPQLAAGIDGDARGAWIGVLMGCDGQPYYLDNLRVSTSVHQTTYDFEGAPSRTRLGWNIKGRKVKYQTLKLSYGSKFWLLGDSWDPIARAFIVGEGTLFQRTHGTSGIVADGRGGFDLESYAAFKRSPKRETTYWFGYGGSDWYGASTSGPLKVQVRAGVNARVNDLFLRPGQRAVVTGKIKPGNRGTKVELQRRSGGWQTLATTKSGGGGRFTVGVTARKVGELVLRLKIGKGDGNIGTVSNSVTVRVRPRPPSGGGGGGGAPDPAVETTSTDVQDPPPTTPNPPADRLRAKTPAALPMRPPTPVSLPEWSTCMIPGAYPLAPCPPPHVTELWIGVIPGSRGLIPDTGRPSSANG